MNCSVSYPETFTSASLQNLQISWSLKSCFSISPHNNRFYTCKWTLWRISSVWNVISSITNKQKDEEEKEFVCSMSCSAMEQLQISFQAYLNIFFSHPQNPSITRTCKLSQIMIMQSNQRQKFSASSLVCLYDLRNKTIFSNSLLKSIRFEI